MARLYTSDILVKKTWEIDPDSMLDVSSGGVASQDQSPAGIGAVGQKLVVVGDAPSVLR